MSGLCGGQHRSVTHQQMEWLWLDPKGVTHRAVKRTSTYPWVTTVWYETWCEHKLTVDDINAKTKVAGFPTCLQCLVADEVLTMIDDEE